MWPWGGDSHQYKAAAQDDRPDDGHEAKLNTASSPYAIAASWPISWPEKYGLKQSTQLRRAGYTTAFLIVLACLSLLAFQGPETLESCLAKAEVPSVSKSSTDWSRHIVPQNLRLPYTPAAVASPQSIKHIQAATKCGVKHHVRVSARGGGHSFGSFGLGGEDGHLVISLERMRAVTLRNDNIAVIQPGAKLGSVATELYKQGQRAIAHGICPGVGIAGHVLHGGVGMATRTFGLTLDWLVGATVVLADGSLVHCSKQENEDLFWALRGAGSSFGVVAEFEFNTFEAPKDATRFTIKFSWDENTAVEGIQAMQSFAMQAPPGFNMLFHMTNHSQVIDGIYYGDRNILDEGISTLIQGTNGRIIYANATDWLPALKHFAYGEELTDGTDDHRRAFYATNAITTTLNAAQIKALASAMFSNFNNASANHNWAYMMDFFGGPTSAVTHLDPYSTSFVHRDKQLLHQFGTLKAEKYPGDEEVISMIQGFRRSFVDIMSASDWGMYANYVDTRIRPEDARKLYWGHNLQRLQRIKTQVDPGDVFWNPQGIRPQ